MHMYIIHEPISKDVASESSTSLSHSLSSQAPSAQHVVSEITVGGQGFETLRLDYAQNDVDQARWRRPTSQ
jgi:hypothetical protein